MTKIRTAALLSCASFLAFSASAFAQQAAPADEAAAEEPITVTGSRIVRNGDDMPTPTTVVTIETMQNSQPTTVADQLNLLPQFAASQGQTTRAEAGSANGGNPNAQGNVLNLRNFGFTRNLILYDNHRVAPNSPNGTVDVDLIPHMLLKRVDVVTGGVSAVYGADAVSGVINFITDTEFKGIKVNASYGISNEGDGRTLDAGVAYGTAIGDRGHFLASYQYRDDKGIDQRSDREWGRNRWVLGNRGTVTATVNGLPQQTSTYELLKFATRPGASFGGTITSLGSPANPLNNFYFSAPNVVSPVVATPLISANQGGAGTGSFFNPSLKGALEMHQGFARFDYELSDSLKFYVRGAYTDTENSGYGISNPTYQASNGSNFHTMFITNPYLPAAIANQMTANGTNGITQFSIHRVFSGTGQDDLRQFTQAFGKNWSIDAGLQGNFGSWKWEAAYIRSQNELTVRQNNAINGRKLAASLDAVNDAGTIKCYVNTAAGTAAAGTQASFYNGCVPFANIFGGTLSQAEKDWIFDPLQSTTKTKMDDFEAFISGPLFDNWAGTVNAAISGQIRKQSYQVQSSTTPATLTNPLNCAGLRLISCSPTSLEYFMAESLSRPAVSVSVKEAALELDVPLFRDSPFGRKLDLNMAARLTDYSTSGSVWTWKFGLDWDVTEDLTLRATRSRDIRAPSMHELFAPQSVGNYNGTDQLLNVVLNGTGNNPAPAGLASSGNPALRPEIGDTVTLGAIYRPSGVPGLSFAVDYFDIKVKDAIVTYTGSDAATQLDCISSGGTSATCALIVRSGTGVPCVNGAGNPTTFTNCITRVFTRSINIGQQYTRGIDMEMNYVGEVFNRPLNFRLLATYQPKSVIVDALSLVETNNAGAATGSPQGTGHARWRATAMLGLELFDNFKMTIMERYRGPMNWFHTQEGSAKANAQQFIIQNAPSNVEAKWYTNVNLAYDFGIAEAYVNIQNLFNTAPAVYANPNAPFAGLNGVVTGDDAVGRYFTFGFRAKF